ncbi:MAG TPA: hypothetical protein VFX92_14675 [Candidatus Krumholzibacteria bacterium]|nr:hypothetical protein [Candidatus Krumholzibacteria bacterium]
MRSRIAYTALTAAIGVAMVGLAAPGPRRVNIRWAESVTLAQRVAAERSLGVTNPRAEAERTWSYEVPDPALIRGIVSSKLIQDTHHIERDHSTFSPEVPASRARARRVYQSAPFRVATNHWPLISSVLMVIAIAAAWPSIRATSARAPDRLLIPFIVGAAVIARLAIIAGGGQFYWPDEDRYRQSREMVEDLAAGNLHMAWDRAMESAHPLFKVIGLLPAAVEWNYVQDPRIPAAFFAMFSVVNIWLLAAVARRLGADAAEATLVALLFAAATSFLYFARHLFPYDASMTFGLLALWAGTVPAGSWRASAACGALAAVCFLTYFGYWTLGGAACVIHVLGGRSIGTVVRRGPLTAAGLAAPLLLLVGTSVLLGGNIVAYTRTFMGDVNQGSFAEGWRVPIEYLWHAEHALLALWIAAVVVCLAGWRRWLAVPRVRVGLAGLLFIYGTLTIFSTGFDAFVVYGRLARQLVPFFCLVTAAVLAGLTAHARMRQAMLWAAAVAVVIQAAFTARPVFVQQFPPEFITRGERIAGEHGASHAVTLYAAHLYPPERLHRPAGYADAFVAPHPLQYLPYQYEGYTPTEREFLRSTDIRMRLLIDD